MGDLSKNPHPFGQLPCVTDSDGVLLFESGAILQYLNFEYAKLPKAQLAAVISWITWANASLDPICFLETPEGKVYDTGLRKKNKRIDRLETILEKQDYLVKDVGFSLADVAVGAYLLYVVQFFPDCGSTIPSLYPNVASYMLRLARRDAYGKAFSDRTQQFVLQNLSEGPSKKLFGVF
jgi:glutathione S-transferase